MGNQTARRQVSDQPLSVDASSSLDGCKPSASAASERTFIWEFLRIPTLFLAWALFDLKVFGRRHVPRSGGVLIVSNHQSNLDPVLMGVKLQRPLNYIAKSELFHRRFGRWLLRSLNAFPVRLGKGDVGAVRETIRRLQQGHIVNIYPEGRRTPDGRIQPLQKGVALIIKRANVPVIPAAIIGAYEAWPIHRRYPRRAKVRIRLGEAMDLASLQSEAEIIAAIDRELRRMFEQMNRRFGTAPAAPPVATSTTPAVQPVESSSSLPPVVSVDD